MAIDSGPPAAAITESADEEPEDEPTEPEADAPADRAGPIERRIDQRIDERVDRVDRRLEELEGTITELDDYARISLGERRIAHNEANVAEFSDSLTAFAERTMSKANAIEEQLQVQRLLLAAMLEALEEADVDVDLSAVERYREDRVVTDASNAQLEDAIERLS